MILVRKCAAPADTSERAQYPQAIFCIIIVNKAGLFHILFGLITFKKKKMKPWIPWSWSCVITANYFLTFQKFKSFFENLKKKLRNINFHLSQKWLQIRWNRWNFKNTYIVKDHSKTFLNMLQVFFKFKFFKNLKKAWICTYLRNSFRKSEITRGKLLRWGIQNKTRFSRYKWSFPTVRSGTMH